MNTGKVRIYELSKELNLDNRDILAVCDQLNIAVKSHSSTITEAEAAQIRSAAEMYTGNYSSANRHNSLAQDNSSSQARKSNVRLPVKKQQILEIRRHRPLAAPPKRTPDQLTDLRPERPVNRLSGLPPEQPKVASTLDQRLSVCRTSRTRQGYIDPLLDVGTALPLHMVFIPGGIFIMGSPDDELERDSDSEEPQRKVTISQFFMGRYPITQAQWRAVAHLPQVEQELDPEPSQFKGKDNHPVDHVSWYDVVEFCARLEKHTNRPYRLPSEAEWEYACRAGTSTPFYFGQTLTDELANYNASVTYADGTKGKRRGETTAVDYFGIANAFGLSDMHGNVFEWCQDYWHRNYESAPTDGSAWLIDGKTSFRVLRGGSWLSVPKKCRSASRYNGDPVFRNYNMGFRVCCSSFRT